MTRRSIFVRPEIIYACPREIYSRRRTVTRQAACRNLGTAPDTTYCLGLVYPSQLMCICPDGVVSRIFSESTSAQGSALQFLSRRTRETLRKCVGRPSALSQLILDVDNL